MSELSEVQTRRGRGPDQQLRYGSAADQIADVWRPIRESGEAGHDGGNGDAAIVVVHGGFWRAEYDRKHTYPLCRALASIGVPVAAIEYRRVGQHGGGWPGTFDDVARALDTIGGLLEVRRLIVVGHSAGGALALWAASRHRLPEHSRWWQPRLGDLAVISLAGVCDLAEAWAQRSGNGAVAELLGNDHHRLAEVDPMLLLGGGVPMTLLHGDGDALVPVALSRRYAAAAADCGDPVEVRVLRDQGHFELIDPATSAWPEVRRAVVEHMKS